MTGDVVDRTDGDAGSPSRAAILMVDDDVELCALIAEYLGGHGYHVSTVYDGSAGLRCAIEGRHDLVILDVMLPLLDGFVVLHQLRKRSDVPVIMLTARADEHDRVEGFRQGADDYLAKPFAAAELLGRVRAVLRRTSGAPALVPRVLEVDSLRLDTQTQEAYWDGEPLGLTSSEFAILEVLARAAGRVVSRDELSAVMHQREATPFERSIDVHVSHLRKKLDAAGHSIIRTVRGIGYLCSVGDGGV
jgi:two-component system response regulator CpxR